MTPLEIELAARRRYNAVDDTFWPQAEIMVLIWEGCLEMAVETQIIERTFTTTATVGTQEYAYPTNAMAIKRITFNGERVNPYDFTEDDEYTLYDADSTEQGTPRYFVEYNETIIFRPIPDTAGTIKIRAYCTPQDVTTTSTLEIPAALHGYLVAYVLKEMVSKDQNPQFYDRYNAKWEKGMDIARRYKRKRATAGGFSQVRNVDLNEYTIFGV